MNHRSDTDRQMQASGSNGVLIGAVVAFAAFAGLALVPVLASEHFLAAQRAMFEAMAVMAEVCRL